MSALHDLTALEQGAAIRSGEVSRTELVEHYAERAERLNPSLGAFVTLAADQARKRALDDLPEGPLAGVVSAVKDLNLTAGIRTTFGSALFAGYVPEFSDEVVLRMERAGLLSLGKTNTPEFGSPCYTEPDVAPPAVTPWDTSRMAGGSSGGAAAAVAGGLVAVAQGSDGGGSIRIPASCCGLVGLKPTRGRISGSPMYGEVTGLATAGPLARTVRDAAAFLDVLAGRAVGDPFWAPEPDRSFLEACASPPGRLRVGRFAEPVIAETSVDPACLEAWENASRLLESLGHEVEDIAPPMERESVATFETCWAVLTALSTVSLSPEDRARLRALTRWLGGLGERVSGPQFGLALGELRRIAAGVLERLAPYDVVLTPTLASPPLPVGALRNDEDPSADFEAQKRFTPWTSLYNVTGSPAISLPLHQTPEGLPVGIMLAAAPGREDLLLSLAAQVEEAAPWIDRKPPCW
ncbi:MAG: amidase [Nocardioidaceae bacterium]|nr:amidase [Nocardioidaceae bacterium]